MKIGGGKIILLKIVIYFILFFFGLAIGSFLNVVALRYLEADKRGFPKDRSGLTRKKFSIGGRSRCPICRKTLVWYELIPIFSFLIQKRKCRHCGHLISLQYPLVEILTGIIFITVPYYLINFQFFLLRQGYGGQSIFQLSNYQLLITIIWLLIFLLFLLLSIIDFRQYIIPDSINLSLAVLGIVLIISQLSGVSGQMSDVNGQWSFFGHYAMLFDFGMLSTVNSQWSIVISHIFAALIAMLFFGTIILLTKGKAMGWGDFKLVGPLGLIFGWPDIIMVLFLAFIIGAVFSVVLLIRKKKKMKEAVPFGPFLIAGASLTFFFGYQIIDGYFKLFGL